MKSFYVRWNGTITRDCGVATIEANNAEEARRTFNAQNPYRSAVWVQEAPPSPKVTVERKGYDDDSWDMLKG